MSKDTEANSTKKQEIEIDQFEVIRGPEIVIGLVGPLGTDLDEVWKALRDAFKAFNYEAKRIRLTESLTEIEEIRPESADLKLEQNRIDSFMTAGTKLRESSGWGAVVALLAVGKIRELRKQWNIENGITLQKLKGNNKPESDLASEGVADGEKSQEPIAIDGIPEDDSDLLNWHAASKVVYVLHSLKHEKEVEALRNIYGSGFFLISAYEPKERRIDHLARKFASTSSDGVSTARYIDVAESLVQRDEDEQGRKLGQSVGKVFPLADLFVNTTSPEKMRESITRFVDLLFQHPFITPRKDEAGMFHAKSASLLSADLSRQVGAAIYTPNGDLIATGYNEVPKADGGCYWDGEADDNRDWRTGWDSNAKKKEEIFTEIVNVFQKINLIPKDAKGLPANILESLKSNGYVVGEDGEQVIRPIEVVEEVLYGAGKSTVKESRVNNLLEFGRVVHAEMNAISNAARRGLSLQGATLYCTTFPCHMCARHIIAAGIKRVVYVEPYPKSLAKDLYEGEILVDPPESQEGKVPFEAFIGVSPNRYSDLFRMKERKNERGEALRWDRATAQPMVRRFFLGYTHIEVSVLAKLRRKFVSMGLKGFEADN